MDEQRDAADVEAPEYGDLWDTYVIVTECEDDEQMERAQAALREIMPKKRWTVRAPYAGEAAGTYGTDKGGSLQILGYTLPVPDAIHEAIMEAWNRSIE